MSKATSRQRIRRGWSLEKFFNGRPVCSAISFKDCFRCQHNDCIRAVKFGEIEDEPRVKEYVRSEREIRP